MTAKTKFEQLIEYVINDEEQKAQELFHSIVVEKSREIYESLMNEEEDAEEADESEEDLDEGTSGSASEDLVREVETDEEGMCEDEEAEEEEEEGEEEELEGGEEELEGDKEELEDRVVDLEDKLDELMAEFETLMGDEEVAGDEEEFDMEPVDDEVGGDAYAMDDTAEFDDAEELAENISLSAAPKPETAEPSFVNKKSTYAANAGQAGMEGKPVKNSYAETNPDGTAAYKAPTSYADKGRGDLPGAGKFKNVPAKDGSKLEPATKPVTTQASGSNTKTPFPKG